MNENNITDTEETTESPTQEETNSQEQSEASEAQKSNKDEITQANCKFTEGQLIKFVRVRFPGHAKSYPFLVGKRALMYGQKVVAMSDRGIAVGYINSFAYEVPFSKDMLPIRSINKVATQVDFDKERESYKRQKEIETICQNSIEKHKLDMNLTHVEFTQFGKKVVFYFVAPNRVDFRGLVKDLVTELKLRIELRQISLRDRAASMGALGPCGRELCCSSFLSRYGNVSIKMAKNQNLTLNYSKLNGVCGQLKCCLQYEEAVYDHKRKILPDESSMVETKNGDIGLVRKIHILTEQFDLLTTKGYIRRYTADQYVQKSSQRLPTEFDSIIDETNTIFGLSELEAKKVNDFNNDMVSIKSESEVFADNLFEELTGVTIEDQVKREVKVEPAKTQIAIQENFLLPQESIQEDEQTAQPAPQENEKLSAKDDESNKDNRAQRSNKNRRRNFKGKRPHNKGGPKKPTT